MVIRMLQYKVEEINTGLYLIKDPLDVNMYLIIGNKRALLFDTGYGVGSIPEAIKSITSKPLTVVLGHGHIDHANGAYQFDEVYLHEDDYELFADNTSPETRSMILNNLKEENLEIGCDEKQWCDELPCELLPIITGQIFDLGGLSIEVVDMAGHTGGSIGLLIKEMRILLDSDSANEHCWMFLEQSLPVREYISMLKRVKELDFDTFYTAHSDIPHPKSDFDKYIRVAENATIEKSEPYDTRWHMNPYIYTEDSVSIVISERTLQ